MYSKIFSVLLLIIISSFICSACVSSEKKIDKTNIYSENENRRPTSLPPGTANVFATILKLTVTEYNKTCIARIDTVYGYGASTPPLAIGAEIGLDMFQKLPDKDSEQLINDFSIGAGYKLNLYFSAKKLGNESANKWQIIKIIN